MTQASRARRTSRSPGFIRWVRALVAPPPSGETTVLFGVLAATVVVLVLLGLLMTFSASFVQSALTGDAFSIFRRQLLWCLVGIPATIGVALRDYRSWRPWIRVLVIVSLVLAILVVTPVGIERSGARRWLGVDPLVFQPAELLKLTVPLFTADVLARGWGRIRSGDLHALLVPTVPMLAVVAVLIMAEPDLETAALLVAIGIVMLYVAGLPTRWLLASGIGGVALVGLGIASAGFRMGRFSAWLDPNSSPALFGYQTLQGYYALGSGGWLGTGLGEGRGKWLYLPNAHTDFIFAIIGEELGLLGVLLVLTLYVVIAVVGVRIAMLAPDSFGRLLAVGLVVGILLQASINMGSVVGLLPVTGVTLPFVSFGGTSLVITMISAGLLLSIARHTRPAGSKARRR
ncbi:MAG TPA: putative lipid II flippase FtsW [Euzebyales bacterium]|nr:putative lipid II flippase FtsW [Euzebyales bacterium]